MVISSQNIPYAILHGETKITLCIGYWWWRVSLFLRFQTGQIPEQECMDFLKLWAFALLCGYAFPDVEADRALRSAAEWRLGGSGRKLMHDAQAVCNSTLLRSYTGYSNP